MAKDIISPGWAKRLKDDFPPNDKLRLVRVYQIMNRWERAVTRYEGQDTEFLQDIAEVLK
jgi:hypothetical protein